jgi:hypothetical protein
VNESETFDPGNVHAVLGVGTTSMRHPIALGSLALSTLSGPAVGATPVAPAMVDDGPSDTLVLVAHVWERPAGNSGDPEALTLAVLGAWHPDHADGMDAVRIFRSPPLRAPLSAWDGAHLAYVCAEPGTLLAFTQRHSDLSRNAPAYILVRHVASADAAVPVTSAQATALLDVLHSSDAVLQEHVACTRELVSREPWTAGDSNVDALIAQVRAPRLDGPRTARVRAATPARPAPVIGVARRGPELME